MPTFPPICAITSANWNDLITRFDAAAFKLINTGLVWRPLDHVMIAATVLGGGVYQALMCLGIIFFGWSVGNVSWRRAGYSGLVAIAISTATVSVCKHIWNRPRPLFALFDVRILLAAPLDKYICASVFWILALLLAWRLRRSRKVLLVYALTAVFVGVMQVVYWRTWGWPRPLFDNSFPSGHSMTAFAVAFACSAFVPKLRRVLVPFACLIGISRVYVGAHFPIDVMFGALTGAFLGLGSAAIIRRWSGENMVKEAEV